MSQEDRSQFLGGSDVAAALGLDPYKSRLQLYEEKIGIAEPFEGNYHTRRGTRLEEVAAEEYAATHGVKLLRANQRIVNPRYPFITARIDRRVVGRRKLAEFKCPSLGGFSKMKREGLHEGYIAQMHSYLGTTGYEEGDWGIFSADLWELITVPVEADARLIADIEKQLAAFWNEHVLKRVPPPADDADLERLEIQRSEGTSEVFEVKDPALMEAIRDLRDVKKIQKEAEAIEADAKARIKEFGGEKVGIYRMPGVKLTHYASKGRSSFDVKALAGARPLDRINVGVALAPLFEAPQYAVSREMIEAAIQQVGKADLDLTAFEKQGNPFTVLRVTEEKPK